MAIPDVGRGVQGKERQFLTPPPCSFRLTLIAPLAPQTGSPGRSRIRTPEGLGSSLFQQVEHTPQRLPIEAATDAHTVFAGNIDLDPLRESRWLCDNHPDGSRAEPGSRYCFRQLNTWFAFTSYGRATIETDEPGANDAAIPRFSASGQAAARPPVAFCPYPFFVDTSHFSPSEPKSITLGEMKRFSRRPSPHAGRIAHGAIGSRCRGPSICESAQSRSYRLLYRILQETSPIGTYERAPC